MNEYELIAESRTETGTGAARRLRRSGKVPAVLYGAGKDPVYLTLDGNSVKLRTENEAFFSHVLTVSVDGAKEQAVVKDLQRQPGTFKVLHMDLQRILETEEIEMTVPLHFANERSALGSHNGGVASHQITEVNIRCLPRHLPEYIEVDVSGLDIGDSLHLSDIKLPEGVTLVDFAHGYDEDADHSVFSFYKPMELDVGEEEAEAPEEEEGEVPVVGEEGEEEPSAERDEDESGSSKE